MKRKCQHCYQKIEKGQVYYQVFGGSKFYHQNCGAKGLNRSYFLDGKQILKGG